MEEIEADACSRVARSDKVCRAPHHWKKGARFMKFNIEVDCTPEEARHFLGLPNVVPLQEQLLADLEKKMREAIDSGDPQQMLMQWLPMGARGMEQWQSMWNQMAATASGFQQAAREKKKSAE
ncbi:MAG: DUF6489 family protein [Geminicoccaceae bacterium]